jgi:hypothetical protein
MKTTQQSSVRSSVDSVQEMLYLPEPLLEFGFGQQMVYPRDGLFLFGPSGNTKELPVIRYGVIGTSEGVRRFRIWSKQIASPIQIPVPGLRSKSVEPQHILFPGFAAAFHSEWPTEPPFVIQDITQEDIERALYLENRHEAVHATVDLFVSRLIRECSRAENPPSFWFVVIPELIY